ncbi:hypothetical protein SAMN05216490_2100 [Mucilaginibacter mallensis]|uniref:DUF5018 domain-containing protein n=1 Tax=Mucilaginibacter mallensis TaxID=652787 RepID=A0A1H1W772_MUCMA|nr:hypothetical protein [Mucilaginibacter mallensis]SDS92336.1 hypothetical protein SAMN05216490_2100 [Mucilaginibacter mallensis]
MKNKINLKLILGILFISTLFSSCLKEGLPKYPLFGGNAITNVYVQYRYNSSPNVAGGDSVVAIQNLIVAQVIDTVNNTVNISLAVPAANGTFTAAVRANVNLSHLIMSFDISTAASMAAAGNTPKPGYVGDISKPLTYVVTAANGKKRTWTVTVAPLPAINKYEGPYTSNGYFYHPSDPRAITNLVKSVLTSGPNSVIVDLGDLGSSGYQAVFTIDPATNNVTITAAPGAGGAPYTMFTSGLPTTNPGYTPQWAGSAACNNTYDPATKTFHVRYGYLGSTGWRVTEEAITMN